MGGGAAPDFPLRKTKKTSTKFVHKLCELTKGPTGPYEAVQDYIWDHIGPFGITRVYTGLYRTKGEHTGQYRTIRDHTGPYGTTGDHMGTFGTIRDHT